jgi:hypothetical protein
LHAAPPSWRIHPLPHTVEHDVAAGKLIHVVLDNYATHKHLESPPRGGDAEAGVLAWLYIALSALRSASPQPRPPSPARRELLLQDDAASHPPRRPSLDRRSAGRQLRLSRQAQCQPQTVRPDQIRRRYPGQARSLRVASVLNRCTRRRSRFLLDDALMWTPIVRQPEPLFKV